MSASVFYRSCVSVVSMGHGAPAVRSASCAWEPCGISAATVWVCVRLLTPPPPPCPHHPEAPPTTSPAPPLLSSELWPAYRIPRLPGPSNRCLSPRSYITTGTSTRRTCCWGQTEILWPWLPLTRARSAPCCFSTTVCRCVAACVAASPWEPHGPGGFIAAAASVSDRTAWHTECPIQPARAARTELTGMGIRLPFHSSVVRSWFHKGFNNQTHLSLLARHTKLVRNDISVFKT